MELELEIDEVPALDFLSCLFMLDGENSHAAEVRSQQWMWEAREDAQEYAQ